MGRHFGTYNWWSGQNIVAIQRMHRGYSDDDNDPESDLDLQFLSRTSACIDFDPESD